MTDIKDKTKKNKTLSLKLGTKPLIAPKRNIEAGKTAVSYTHLTLPTKA